MLTRIYPWRSECKKRQEITCFQAFIRECRKRQEIICFKTLINECRKGQEIICFKTFINCLNSFNLRARESSAEKLSLNIDQQFFVSERGGHQLLSFVPSIILLISPSATDSISTGIIGDLSYNFSSISSFSESYGHINKYCV